MTRTIADGVWIGQAETVSLDTSAEGISVSLRGLFRQAIEESGLKHMAVAAAIGVEPQYLSRILSGEKPLSEKHVSLLPKEVGKAFAKLHAQQYQLIVIEGVHGPDALQQFVGGLLGIVQQKGGLKLVRSWMASAGKLKMAKAVGTLVQKKVA